MQMSTPNFHSVFLPKVDRAWNLHHALLTDDKDTLLFSFMLCIGLMKGRKEIDDHECTKISGCDSQATPPTISPCLVKRCEDDQRAAERAAYRSYINNPISDQSFFENYGGRVVSTELEEIFNAMLTGKLPAKWAKSLCNVRHPLLDLLQDSRRRSIISPDASAARFVCPPGCCNKTIQ